MVPFKVQMRFKFMEDVQVCSVSKKLSDDFNAEKRTVSFCSHELRDSMWRVYLISGKGFRQRQQRVANNNK